MSQLYISGLYESRERLRHVRRRFHAVGRHEVKASWLDESTPRDTVTREQSLEAAYRDLAEIRDCDIFILDTLDEDPHGGREVELGYAHAKHKLLCLVGPERNVFHSLIPARYPNWEAWLG